MRRIFNTQAGDYCINNSGRCFFILAATWSLFVVFLLLFGIWSESQQITDFSISALEKHTWVWIGSLVCVWGVVLFALFFALKGISGTATSLEDMSSRLSRKERKSASCMARFEAIVCAITDAIVFTDQNNNIVMTNPAFYRMTGYAFEEVKGRDAGILFASPDALRRKREGASPAVSEMECRMKNGETLPTETLGTEVRDSDGNSLGFLLVLRDISQRRRVELEREKLEARVRLSSKTEAIATLAGGIAHDFNNILGIIFVNTDLALEDIPEDNPARRNIERIVEAATRGRKLVRQVLAYSRRQDDRLIPLMPAPFMKETLKHLFASTPASITVAQDIRDDAETIMMDPLQLKEMLQSLFTNAMQAIHGWGKIEVRGKIVKLEQGHVIQGEEVHPGKYFLLSVADNGVGMNRATIERMFDPFFTTRDVGEGSGMGLAAVMGAVRGHDGYISVESEPGGGTKVEILFPVVDGNGEKERLEKSMRGTERILFVDDEEDLIEMAGIFLERYGFKVTEKTDGREALALFKKTPGEFDIVVTDLAMPGFSGSRLAGELLQVRPDIPIILLSGNDNDISEAEVKELGIREFLRKPFDGRTMVQTIRRVLDTPA
ncbi:MAG: hypothetical protein Kow0089_18900 [Desulfobulbaceae bacterium]